MDDLLALLLFIIGFVLLFKGGDWFVNAAERIAVHYRLSKFLIGATVVSICTTLPEVLVSSVAAVRGDPGISYGNSIGSVICNAALIAAVTIVLRSKANVKPETFSLAAAFFFGAAFLYSTVAWTTGRFSRWTGMLLLVLFVLYEIVLIVYMKKHHERRRPAPAEEKPEGAPAEPKPAKGKKGVPWKDVGVLLAGAAAIAVGSRLLVDNGVILARAIGVPDSVIGLTVVALGTSLPELVTAVKSGKKGDDELWLGNIVGANVLNLVLVSGMAITISPFAVPAEKTLGGVNSSFVIDLPLMLLVMALLCLPALFKGKVMRWQGILLLCLYVAFSVFQYVA